MSSRVGLGLLLWGCAVVATGCGPSWVVGRGISEYEDKEYPKALENFDEVEKDVVHGKVDDAGTARYYVYRGLTHYALFKDGGDKGERRKAVRHLSKASKRMKKGDPSWIPDDVTKQLKAAYEDLGIDPDRKHEDQPGRGWRQ